MIHEVTGCENCPVCRKEEPPMDGYFCGYKEADGIWIEADTDGNPVTPSWCPLKKEDIVIKLVQ